MALAAADSGYGIDLATIKDEVQKPLRPLDEARHAQRQAARGTMRARTLHKASTDRLADSIASGLQGLEEVNGKSCEGMEMKAIMQLMKAAGRPLTQTYGTVPELDASGLADVKVLLFSAALEPREAALANVHCVTVGGELRATGRDAGAERLPCR